MKLVMAQMSMTENIEENYLKTLAGCDAASNCDLIFFPEIQFSPFFPQYEKKDVLLKADDRERLLNCEIDLAAAVRSRRKRQYIAARRPDMYQ